MPEAEVNNLISKSQVATSQVQMGAQNIQDFKYENSTIVIKYNG